MAAGLLLLILVGAAALVVLVTVVVLIVVLSGRPKPGAVINPDNAPEVQAARAHSERGEVRTHLNGSGSDF